MAAHPPSVSTYAHLSHPGRKHTFTLEEFQRIDTAGSGRISKGELVAALQAKTDVSLESATKWAELILSTYDSNLDGGLSLDEFTVFVNKRTTQLHDSFAALDYTKTGKISMKDVCLGLEELKVTYLKEDVRRVLLKLGAKPADLDDNSDGVSFEQFLEASLLLPRASVQDLLTLTGVVPLPTPPPCTTPSMIVTAGFINGIISRTLTAPMDRLRAVLATGRGGQKQQTVTSAAKYIYRTQGLRGFWSSNLANVVQVAPENGLAFTLNELLRDKVCQDPAVPTVLEKFVQGSLAGALAMTAVYPMYVVQNRMAAALPGQYPGMLACIQEVARGGASSWFAGYGTSLVRVLPLKGIMLGGYSTLKEWVKDPRTGEISTARSLVCSATAGGFAHAATYPLHLARTVLQQEVEPGGRKYKGFADVLHHRFSTQGLRGWYRGLPIWLSNRIPAVAIEFAVNERALDQLKRSGVFDSRRE